MNQSQEFYQLPQSTCTMAQSMPPRCHRPKSGVAGRCGESEYNCDRFQSSRDFRPECIHLGFYDLQVDTIYLPLSQPL